MAVQRGSRMAARERNARPERSDPSTAAIRNPVMPRASLKAERRVKWQPSGAEARLRIPGVGCVSATRPSVAATRPYAWT